MNDSSLAHGYPFLRRVCMLTAVVMLLGVSLIMGGVAHDWVLLKAFGIAMFTLATLGIVGVLLWISYSEFQA